MARAISLDTGQVCLLNTKLSLKVREKSIKKKEVCSFSGIRRRHLLHSTGG